MKGAKDVEGRVVGEGSKVWENQGSKGNGRKVGGSRETVFQGQKRHFSFEDRTYNILDIVCPEYSGHLDNAGQCLRYSIFE